MWFLFVTWQVLVRMWLTTDFRGYLSDSVIVEPHDPRALVSFTSTFAGFLPTVGHPSAVALTSY